MKNTGQSDNTTELFSLHEIAILHVLSTCTGKSEDSVKKHVCSMVGPDRFSGDIFSATAFLEELSGYIKADSEHYSVTQKGKERLFRLKANKPRLILQLDWEEGD